MFAANGRHWVSPFPPTNSADEHRFDDVMLAAPNAARLGAGARRDGKWLLLKEDEAAAALARADADIKDGSGRLQFGDAADQSDVESEFELNTGGGRIIFSRAPRAPWPGRGQPVPQPSASAGFDRMEGVGQCFYQGRRQQPSAVIHQAVRTHPMIADAARKQQPQQHQQQELPHWQTEIPNGGNSSASRTSKRFSLRRLLHIKPSSRRSVSRSRSTASNSASALTQTTPTQQLPRSGGVNGKSVQQFTYADSKIYQPYHRVDLPHQNGFANVGRPSAVPSRFSAEVTLGSRSNRPQPAPNYRGS